jgi:hypothetical protein
MSRRSATALLWGVAFATLPVPFYVGASGCEPPLGLAFLAVLAGGVLWTEGGPGTTGMFAWLAIGQALASALVTGLVALLTARALFALVPRRAPLVVWLVCGALLAASLFPIYDTPLSSHGPRSSLLGLFR